MPNKIPANIITGFLGVGKTTAILQLLKNKPANENWAVLVNEFGEIGIDGTMMQDQGAIIKEVPGGCMCCAAGVPTSVAITALLRQKPDRLLVEPTGLGHAKEIVALLSSDQFAPYVNLKATIGLVDPRNLSNEKYRSNQNFNDQLECADVVIGNKVDQCNVSDIDIFNDWVTDQEPSKIFHKLVKQGNIPLEVLDIERIHGSASGQIDAHHHEHASMEPKFELPPGEAYLKRENFGQDYFSCGWLFGAEYQFPFDDLFSLFSKLTAERIKAVVNTEKGCFAFNVSNGVISVNELSLDGFESRIEVIDSQLMPWGELNTILVRLAGIES